jgi:hypothetical protein
VIAMTVAAVSVATAKAVSVVTVKAAVSVAAIAKAAASAVIAGRVARVKTPMFPQQQSRIRHHG